MYASSNHDEKATALRELRKFTYMQCLPKIAQRLITLHPNTRAKFLYFPPPQGVLSEMVLRCSETWFMNIALSVLQYDPRFKLDSENHVILDNRTLQIYHKFIGKVVQEYSMSRIKTKKEIP